MRNRHRLESRNGLRLPSAHSSPNLDENPRRLMSKHHRIDAGSVSDASLEVSMHVGAADPHGFDSHLNFPGTWVFHLPLDDSKLAVAHQLGDTPGVHFG